MSEEGQSGVPWAGVFSRPAPGRTLPQNTVPMGGITLSRLPETSARSVGGSDPRLLLPRGARLPAAPRPAPGGPARVAPPRAPPLSRSDHRPGCPAPVGLRPPRWGAAQQRFTTCATIRGPCSG